MGRPRPPGEVDELAAIDEAEFNAVIGNPPYGAGKPAYKEKVMPRFLGAANGT